MKSRKRNKNVPTVDVNPIADAIESSLEFQDQLADMNEQFWISEDPEYLAILKRVQNERSK